MNFHINDAFIVFVCKTENCPKQGVPTESSVKNVINCGSPECDSCKEKLVPTGKVKLC